MIDLTALAGAVDARAAVDPLLPHAHRVRITERCPLACRGCRPSGCPDIEPALLRRALYSLPRGRVLFAGADPHASPLLDNAIALARGLGHAVELLTPGALLSARRTARLCTLGVERVRIAIDSDRADRLSPVSSAATVARAGLPVDLHVTLLPRQQAKVLEPLLGELAALPVARVILSTRGCRSAEEITEAHRLRAGVRAALRTALAARTRRTPRICLDGRSLHLGLALDALAQEAGTAAARRVERLLLPAVHAPGAAPELALAP